MNILDLTTISSLSLTVRTPNGNQTYSFECPNPKRLAEILTDTYSVLRPNESLVSVQVS